VLWQHAVLCFVAKKNQMPTEQQIKERKWHWIGNTLRKPHGAVERQALN